MEETKMKVSSVFDYQKVPFNQENEVILMASLKAPKIKNSNERAPLNLSLVLDISGSMSGTKLETVKSSVIKLVEQLSERDTVGLVTFGSYVHEIFEPQVMSSVNKNKIIYELRNLRTEGCTNMSGGILKGFEQLKKVDAGSNHLHRMLIFTDGYANEGLRSTEQFNEMLAVNLNGKITISCFGYGDHDEAILKNISETGKGNFYFINNIEEISKTFARELGGLLTCYAQNITIHFDLKNGGGQLMEVVNDLTCVSADNNKVKVTLDDIYSEEEKHILVKIKLNKATKALTQRASSIVDILVTYNDLTDSSKFKINRSKSKINFVKSEDADKEKNIKVLEQLALIELGKAHDKARLFADQKNFISAQQVYSTASSYVLDLKTRNSTLGDIIGTSIAGATSCLSDTNYSSAHANSLSNTARGLKYMKALDTTTSALYATSTQKSMEESFTDKSKDVKPSQDATIQVSLRGTSPIIDPISSTSTNITINNGSLFGLGTLGQPFTISSPFISDAVVNLTPDPKNAGKEANKKDGLNKRKSA